MDRGVAGGEEDGETVARDRLGTARDFLRYLLRKSREDGINLKASALAFATILGLVPLLATFSFVGTRLVDRYQDRLLEILEAFLPYSEAAMVDRLEMYVHQAESLQGLGLLAFLFVGGATLHTIEETINQIWRVGERGSLRSKLLSLALILFWGPLLFGAGLSLFVMARGGSTFGYLLEESLLVGLLPVVVTTFGLSMLYWQVPRVQVRFRWALVSGVLVAVFLEALRRPFAYYVGNINQLSLVYGSFAIAILFMISIQVAWWAILVGAEVAYVGQHFAALRRGREADARAEGPWIALASALHLVRSLRRGRPIVPPEEIAAALGLPPTVVEGSLEPLVEDGLVAVTESEGLTLARDAHTLAVESVLGSHDGPIEAVLDRSTGPEWDRLRELRASLRELRHERTGRLMLVELLEDRESQESAEPGASDQDSTASSR